MSIVTPEQTKLNALMTWVQTARTTSPLLDDEADALLANLNAASAHFRAIARAQQRPPVLGLYGHSHEGKAHLLRSLVGSADGRIVVNLGDKPVDYLNQINPGHRPLSLALRFVPRPAGFTDGYPLTLRLFSEADLVQLLMLHYHAQPGARAPERLAVEQHIQRLRDMSQPQTLPGSRPDEIMQIARHWQTLVPASERHLDDAHWQQLAEIVPTLDLAGRALAWSLFWGEQRELTQHWLELAEALQRLGHAGEVFAPQSLLIDNFSLPVDGFLTESELREDDNADVLVRPVEQGEAGPAVNLALSVLNRLCAELVLPVPQQALDDVEVVDIPGFCLIDGVDMALTRRRFLLEWYRKQLQPDVLLICNAAPSRAAIPALSRQLWHWVETTQPAKEDALPGLVWAITPHDARFSDGEHLDEAIQRLLGKPGQRWGTLQALDGRNLQRLTEWLGQALDATHHAGRLAGLRRAGDSRLAQLFSRFNVETQANSDAAKAEAEQTVRGLQRIAARHGELLEGLLPAGLVQQLPQPEAPVITAAPRTPFDLNVDLFAAPQMQEEGQQAAPSHGNALHKAWVNHVRHWTRRADVATHFGLTGEALQHLGDILVVTSYRLDLAAALDEAMHTAARGQARLGDFLTWLGYDAIAPASRPASRVQPGATIFAPAPAQHGRLTKLGEQPAHAATQFVYDWLVALYTRAVENIGYQHPLDINDKQRDTLRKLLG